MRTARQLFRYSLIAYLALAVIHCVPEGAGVNEHLAPFPGEELAILDEALETIVGDVRTESDEFMALKVLRFVSQRFTSGPPSDYHKTGTSVLQGGRQNLCGDKAILLVALCRRLGLPARVITFDNFGALSSHIATEVYFNGGWRFLDPTAGLFFYSVDPYDGTGEIYSRKALAENPARTNSGYFVGDELLWNGRYIPESTFVSLPPGYRKEPWQPFTLLETYQRLFEFAFPHPDSRSELVSFPIAIEGDANGEAWVGVVDGNSTDCNASASSDGAPRYYGTHTIGQADLSNTFHTLMITLDRPGNYRITYHFTDHFPNAQLRPQALADAFVINHGRSGRVWHCSFRAQTNQPLLMIQNMGQVALLDAIHLERQ